MVAAGCITLPISLYVDITGRNESFNSHNKAWLQCNLIVALQ